MSDSTVRRFIRENYSYPGAWKVALAIVGLWVLAGLLTGRLI